MEPVNSIEKNNNTTFQKIIKLQEDLKIISSIKKQFEGNRRKMIDKIFQGCYNYYKNIINMKKIFDYCSHNEPEKIYEYNLLTEKQAKDALGNNYNYLFQFFFFLRSDNNLMIKLLENIGKEDYDDISDFLVNFCYEDTIKYSFIQEDLLILIYLLLEKYIINSNLDINTNKKSYEDYYSLLIKNNILNKIFISLTRKEDVRNYLYNILSEMILYIDKFDIYLSVDIAEIHDIMKKNKAKTNPDNCSIKNRQYTLSSTTLNSYLKSLKNSLKNNNIKNSAILSHKSTIISNSTILNKKESEINEEEKEEKEKKDDINNSNLNLYINQNIDPNSLDKFFIETDTTLEYMEKKLEEYEAYKEEKLDENNNNIIEAMKEYLNIQINEIKNDENKLEAYSNFVLINSLNSQKTILKEESEFNFLVNYIKTSYQDIIEIISSFLTKIKQNINSIPFIIKYISNIIDILLKYKYPNMSIFNKYIFKINFFFGNIIIPILENPFYNGIITTNIISDINILNLRLIASIFKLIISGKLFYVGVKPCMTIFNKFIIEILPQMFEIIQNIESNFKLPEITKELISSIKDMNNINRKINYNYFFENTEEKFQIQSICFSYTNAVNIIKALEKINKTIKYDKNNIKEIIDYIIKNAEKYKFLFINALLNQKKEINNFIYISKIEYLPSLEARMNSILKDNFISINPPKKEKMKEEEISRFKRCLSEVLTYTNLIHREDIPTFTEIKSNKYIYDLNLIEKLLKKLEKKRYDEIMGKNSENIVEEKNIVLNPDFKSEILPKILLKIKDEIMINSYDEYLQRILYCCSYIQLHIELLPEKYILNNYKNLFIELIKDTEDNVHILRNNILNQLNIKIKDSLKTNLIISSIHNQIKNLEKLKCIQYLYNKMEFPYFFEVKYSLKGIIKSITFIEDTENLSLNKINELIPDFNKCENIENIFEFQESVNMDKALDDFFIKLKKLIKKEKIIKKYSPEETLNISYDLVDFICGIIYNKIFPKKKSKLDSKFYKKCLRLQFIKPENLVEDKNIINENLCEECLKYINDIEQKITPGEKIKCFGKAFSILQNSIKFSSGKSDLGVDDSIKPLIYVMIKAKPQNIFSNYNYCRIYLDKELSKKQYGAILTQIGMIINIIKDMKYTELFNVTEEQFGFDEN